LDLRKRFPNGTKACGADALRFALLRHDLTIFQIHMDIARFSEEGLRFCNKVWNMCKYVERVSLAARDIPASTSSPTGNIQVFPEGSPLNWP
jgi:valyl-tRNA synthetase